MPQHIKKLRVISHSYDCVSISERTEGNAEFPRHDNSSDLAHWREQPTDHSERHINERWITIVHVAFSQQSWLFLNEETTTPA